jgi:imidazolonepropionase-like amidohydrolase
LYQRIVILGGTMAANTLLFTHVQVFDGTGSDPFPAEVRVADGVVAEVSPPRGRLARDGARVIDGGGHTLMPGLIEPHAHLSFPDAATRADFEKLPPEEHALVAMHNARKMLDAGYTSCLSAASAKPRLDVVVRNEINAGRIPGPRMLANGPEITVTGGLGDINQLHLPYQAESSFSIVIDGADEMRKVCRTLVREGVDLLKVNLSGDLGQPRAHSEQTVMTDAEVAACVEVARSRNLRVCCHARSAEAVRMALRHEIPVIYHANYADEDALDRLEAAKDRVFVAPRWASRRPSATARSRGERPTRRPRSGASCGSWSAASRPLAPCTNGACACCPAGITALPGRPMAPTPETWRSL